MRVSGTPSNGQYYMMQTDEQKTNTDGITEAGLELENERV
jgi:hypothetical protein